MAQILQLSNDKTQPTTPVDLVLELGLLVSIISKIPNEQLLKVMVIDENNTEIHGMVALKKLAIILDDKAMEVAKSDGWIEQKCFVKVAPCQ